MPAFKCKIKGRDGQIRELTRNAPSKAILKKELERSGDFVLEIDRFQAGGIPFGRTKRLKIRDFYAFNQEFAVLLKSGLPVVAALDAILENEETGSLDEMLKEVRGDVASGESLADSFAKYENVLSKLYIASLQAGEKSGNIPLALTRYIESMKKIAEIRQKVVSASVYPAILTAASVAVLAFLLMFVVPAITGTFLETGTRLPAMTTVLLKVSEFLKGNIIYIIVFFIAGAGALWFYKSTPTGELAIDRGKLAFPFLGRIYIHFATSKFTRTLSTVFAGGIPLVDALKISSDALANRYIQLQLDAVVRNVEQGNAFSNALAWSGVFPTLAVRMISAGEGSGALDQVLNDVADFYEEDVSNRLTILTSSIEPALMLIMGFLVGFIVLAMYMPIFQLAGTM